jgi:hypothetical protein
MTVLYTNFTDLNDEQRNEVRTFGCTVEEMRAVVESSLTFKCAGPAMLAASIMSDCQEMLARDNSDMTIEDVRQAINRAKWVLFTYINDRES